MTPDVMIARLRDERDDLYAACRTALDLLHNLTTEQYAQGGDRVIRDRLAGALDASDVRRNWPAPVHPPRTA